MELSGPASGAGVSHTTARRWLWILEAGFIVFLPRPYYPNSSERLVKPPEFYFVDAGGFGGLLEGLGMIARP